MINPIIRINIDNMIVIQKEGIKIIIKKIIWPITKMEVLM